MKSKEFELVRGFMGYQEVNICDDRSVGAEDYSCFIGDLWPVMVRCKKIAQENPEKLAKPWFLIAAQLNRVEEDIHDMYDQVINFIIEYNKI